MAWGITLIIRGFILSPLSKGAVWAPFQSMGSGVYLSCPAVSYLQGPGGHLLSSFLGFQQ